MKTKIFCDIAELDQIKKFNKKKIVKGFTTNPSLMRKAGASDYKSYSKKILKICDNKPVSLEVFADEYSEMKIQAVKINTWGKNVFVKVPVANSKGKFMGRIIKELNDQNIKLNITAVYNAKQARKILKFINLFLFVVDPTKILFLRDLMLCLANLILAVSDISLFAEPFVLEFIALFFFDLILSICLHVFL